MISRLSSLVTTILILSQAAQLACLAEPVTHEVAAGEELSSKFKYSEAEKLFNDALKKNPQDVRALLGLAKVYRHQGKAALSINATKLATKLEPTNALCYLETAKMLHTLHRYPRAILACKRAVQLDPNNAEAYYYLGWSQDLMDHEIEASNNLRKAVKLDPKHSGAWRVLAFTLWQRQQNNEAVQCLQTAIKLSPKNSQMQSELADILLDSNRLTEAAAVYNGMKKTFPKGAESYLGLSDIAARQGQTKLRGELLEQALKVKPTSEMAWLRMAQFHTDERKLDEAVRCSRIALGFKPNSAFCNRALAICLINADKPKEAEQYLQKSIVNSKTNQEKQSSQDLLVHVLFMNNKNDRAMEVAKEMYRLQPNDYWSISALAWALMCFKQYDQGFALLEKGKKLFPEDFDLYKDHLGGLVSAGRYDQAKALGKKMLLKRPKDTYIWTCLMTVATKTHNKKDAEEAMKHTQGLKLSAYEAMEMGFGGMAVGADASSQASLKQAIDENPASVDLIMNTRDPKAEKAAKNVKAKPPAKKL